MVTIATKHVQTVCMVRVYLTEHVRFVLAVFQVNTETSHGPLTALMPLQEIKLATFLDIASMDVEMGFTMLNAMKLVEKHALRTNVTKKQEIAILTAN